MGMVAHTLVQSLLEGIHGVALVEHNGLLCFTMVYYRLNANLVCLVLDR